MGWGEGVLWGKVPFLAFNLETESPPSLPQITVWRFLLGMMEEDPFSGLWQGVVQVRQDPGTGMADVGAGCWLMWETVKLQ
jgi:hypothetical protein